MKNQTLQSIAEQQKGKLDENMQEAFERIVITAMDFFYKNPQTSEMCISNVMKAQNKVHAIGEGVALVMLMLSGKSRGKMPWEAGVMAGYALVCDVLDFFEQKGVVKVDNTVIDEANSAYASKIMEVMKIDGGTIDKLTQQAQDPQVRAAYKQKFGEEIQL